MILAARVPRADGTRLPAARPGALARLRDETGVELILVHLVPQPIGRPVGPYACPPRPGSVPADVDEAAWDPASWEALARDGRDDLELVVRDGSDLLFRVRDRR